VIRVFGIPGDFALPFFMMIEQSALPSSQPVIWKAPSPGAR
jgi:hypothetical protein